MTTFQPVILQCPFCKQKMYNYELTSFTVYQSTVYSDSKTNTEPYVDNDWAIRICPSCKQAIWVEDAIIDSENPYELVDTVPKALDILDLPFNMTDDSKNNTIGFYKKLLKQGFAYSNDKKYYLRIRLWWAINDLIRYRTPFFNQFKRLMDIRVFWNILKNNLSQKHDFKNLKKVFNDNLEQLAFLIDPITDDDYLLMAEIYRELGNFKLARRNIKKISGLNNKAAKKIRQKNLFHQKRVFKL